MNSRRTHREDVHTHVDRERDLVEMPRYARPQGASQATSPIQDGPPHPSPDLLHLCHLQQEGINQVTRRS